MLLIKSWNRNSAIENSRGIPNASMPNTTAVFSYRCVAWHVCVLFFSSIIRRSSGVQIRPFNIACSVLVQYFFTDYSVATEKAMTDHCLKIGRIMRLGVTWYQVAYNLIITTVIDIRGKITSYKKVWTKVIMNQFQNLCTEPIIQSI